MNSSEYEHDGFDRQKLFELFAELDAELATANEDDDDKPHRIAIAGGAAVSLCVSSLRTTGDVDVISEGMSEAIRRAAARVAERHNLRTDWINDAAKLKTVALEPELKQVFGGTNLVVESVGAKYLLAMKLVSARPLDHSDCVDLVRQLRVRNLDELLDLVQVALPRAHHRTVTTQYFADGVLDDAWRSYRFRAALRDLWVRLRRNPH